MRYKDLADKGKKGHPQFTSERYKPVYNRALVHFSQFAKVNKGEPYAKRMTEYVPFLFTLLWFLSPFQPFNSRLLIRWVYFRLNASIWGAAAAEAGDDDDSDSDAFQNDVDFADY